MSVELTAERFTHLRRLEAEAIHIMREVAAEAENPVMLYSVGKDSSVLLHIAMKAFYPSKPPFPFMHVDTTWKFSEMIAFRDEICKRLGIELIVHINQDGVDQGVGPFTHGSSVHTDIMKTAGLKQALDKHKFDVAFGGARRDEEKSRAKERIFSFRTDKHRWDPKSQRPELWNLYNARKHKGESIRVFPISNWTELDVWQYIEREKIALPSIYFAHNRSVFERDGMLLAADYATASGTEEAFTARVRYRTLGDANITGAVESDADTVDKVVAEVAATRITERGATRADDRVSEAAMEDRKKEGYF
jgi:sulfate adenylyltransferase subunit 2